MGWLPFFVTLYNEKFLMITLIKNKGEVGYKITLRKVEMERRIELGLDGIGRVGFGGGFFDFLFFYFLKILFFNFLIFNFFENFILSFENFLIFLRNILFSLIFYVSVGKNLM